MGGWLLFFILTLVLFSPVVHVLLFLGSYRVAVETVARLPHPDPHYLFYAVEQLSGVALYGYGVFAGIQLWKTEPAALTHAKQFLLLLVLYQLTDFATAILFARFVDPSGTLSRYVPRALVGQLRMLIYPVVWYGYLLKSKRVRNTFGLGQAASSSYPIPL